MQTLSRVHLDTLTRDGWADLGIIRGADLVTIGLELGPVVPSVPLGGPLDLLKVKRDSAQEPRSYSGVYGEASFPFHTDAAYYLQPPKYLLLRLQDDAESDRPTLLWDLLTSSLSSTELRALAKEQWVVRGGSSPQGRNRGFITKIVSGSQKETVVRFDPNVMKPYLSRFSSGASILNNCEKRASKVEIHWKPGQTVVINNQRLLHSRGDGPTKTSNRRVLERVLVAAR